MTIEELEAEANKIIEKFEHDFENTIRPFYRSMKAFAENVDTSTASNHIKQALLLSVLDTLNKVGSIADRVWR